MILACTTTIFFDNFITEAINIVHWNWPSQLNSPVFCPVTVFERNFEWTNTSHFELWKSWIPWCEICESTDYISQVIQFLWNVIFAKCRSWNSNLFSAYLIDFLRGRKLSVREDTRFIPVKGSNMAVLYGPYNMAIVTKKPEWRKSTDKLNFIFFLF